MTYVPRKTADGKIVHRHRFDHMPANNWYSRMNKKIAIKVTGFVGTMTCAYLFGLFDLLALPEAIKQGLYGIVQWMASFFLQLVLLSIIMVGQATQGEASDIRSQKTLEDTEKTIDLLSMETAGGLKDLYDKIHREIDDLKEMNQL